MSAHTFTLNELFVDRQVGNSMSTNASFDGQHLTIDWKGQKQTLLAKIGSRVMITCNGGFPDVKVMIAPSNPVNRVVWENCFYSKKRFATLQALRDAAEKVTFYSRPHGYDLDGVKIYVSGTGNCAIAYKAAMEGQIGTPWGWWANDQATADDVANLISTVLTTTGAGVFTNAYAPMERVINN